MSLRIFDFSHAIVRAPGHSVVRGIRSNAEAAPDFARLAGEHRLYVAALRAAGLEVEVLPPLERYPDSIFVEDPALVFPEGAILLRPGAPQRLGEREELRSVLNHRFRCVLELQDGEDADGGDVLMTPKAVFIGLSRRTNRAGADALRAMLAALGHAAEVVATPPSALHLKSAASLLSEDTIVATRDIAECGLFAGYNILSPPADEEAAANLLRVNDVVFVGACFPRTIDLIGREGFSVVTLPVTEIGKLDAGLSCMSLRWRNA